MLKYVKKLWDINKMADDSKKLYMEMQMDELKASLAMEDEDSTEEENNPKAVKKKTPPKNNNNNKNAEVAKLYEDAFEYEEELEAFEKELEIINSHQLKDITKVLSQHFSDEDRNYEEELKAVLILGWTHLVEAEQTHPKEQLAFIQENEFSKIIETFSTNFPEYANEFEAKVREIFLKRWETIIAIKKEHIEQEIEEIYIAGLKPSFVKRIYKQFHGIK